MSNDVVIEAWNTVLFEKFSRFKFLFVEGYASISQAVFHRQPFPDGSSVLDVGCGGGLLAEALDAKGAKVTAIDVTEANIEIAKLHAQKMQVDIDYRLITAEDLAEKENKS